MTVKLTVIYDTPQHPAAFDAAYAEHMTCIARTPSLQRVETHRAWPTGHNDPTLAYRLVELYFEDSVAFHEAAGGFLPDILRVGAEGVHIVCRDAGSHGGVVD